MKKGSQKEKEITMKKVKDHLGNEYKSISDMCRHYGIDRDTYVIRVKRGMTVEKSLTTPVAVRCRGKKYTDHFGNVFNSLSEMCKHYEIDANLFRCRERLGWSLKDILETPRKVSDRRKEYTDSDGNKFKNKAELANFHNMSDVRYYNLIKSGYTLEDDKDHKFGVGSCNVVTDPFGRTHRTLLSMLKFYDIPTSSYVGYMVTGRSMTDVLVDKMNKRLPKIKPGNRYDNVVDHLGKSYETISDMCRHYNISHGLIRDRLLAGWSLKDALTIPANPDIHIKTKEVEDHLGNKYNSLASMCKHYGMSDCTYRSRIQKGWTLEKALTTPVRPKKKYNRD